MDDIFQQALSGNTASIKALYTASVESAYAAILSVAGEQETAVEMVKEIYIWAFSSAGDYEEFFAHLNQRAAKACKVLVDKSAAVPLIESTYSVFDDIAAMPIPDELKQFPDVLAAVVLRLREEQQAQKKVEKPERKGKKNQPKNELEEFDELVKKHEFSVKDAYSAPVPEPVQVPKTIAEKLQAEDEVLTDEQRIRQKIDMEKNRRTSVIVFIFTAIIFAGALATWYITSQPNLFKPGKNQILSSSEPSTLPEEKKYREGEQLQAFGDYLQDVILVETHLVDEVRTVAYNETTAVGLDQLCGVVSTKAVDVNGDGVEEFAVIRSEIEHYENTFRFRFLLDMYAFNEQKVEQVFTDYHLLDYNIYNTGVDYDLGNFKMKVKLDESTPEKRIIAYALSKQMKIYAFHYFENGQIKQAERLSFLNLREETDIYLQKRADGTQQALYLRIYDKAQKDSDVLDEDSLAALRDYGFTLGKRETKFQSLKAFKGYVNKLAANFGCRFTGKLLLTTIPDTAKTLCTLEAENEQGDMLTRREIVAIRDFSGLHRKQDTTPAVTTQAQTTEPSATDTEVATDAPSEAGTTNVSTSAQNITTKP